MKFSEQTLIRVIEQIEAGGNLADAAAYVGTSDRLLRIWREKSRRHVPGFFLIYRGMPGYFHAHIEAARERSGWMLDPEFADWSDNDFAAFDEPLESRFLHDDDGNRIPRPPLEDDDGALDDILAERERAAIEATREKRKADGRVTIYGRGRDDGPPERISGEPEELTQAEKERRHPRAHQSVNADLKPPNNPPPWLKPKKLEGAGIGVHAPPSEGRFNHPNVPQRSYSVAERKAGTLEFTGSGIRRW